MSHGSPATSLGPPAGHGLDDGSPARPAGGVQRYRLTDLRLTMSPRLEPRDHDHIATLAECIDELPPIVVLEPAKEVVDGLHRVMAARLRGRELIDGVAFIGSAQDAYVEAVRANIAHGKALTLDERRVAARRILAARPEWSDRRVAGVCGLASQTVAVERQRIPRGDTETLARIGADGRSRPTDPVAGRLRVAELLGASPGLSLRRLAAEAGTSQATALDVRRRMARGTGPLPPRLESASRPPAPAGQPSPDLPADPALTDTENGRAFLEWFERHRIDEGALEQADLVPRGRVYAVADEANRQSKLWAGLAAELERRGRGGRLSAT